MIGHQDSRSRLHNMDMTLADTMQKNVNTTPSKITGIGARLKSAREAMGLSEKDVASHLHLSPKYILMMENEDFSNGPPVTFIRGYLKSYARYVHIPAKEIDQALEALSIFAPEPSAISIKPNVMSTPRDEKYIRWGTYLIALIMMTLVAIWWSSRTKDSTSASQIAAPIETQSAMTESASEQPPVTDTSAVPPAITQPMTEQTPPAAAGARTTQPTALKPETSPAPPAAIDTTNTAQTTEPAATDTTTQTDTLAEPPVKPRKKSTPQMQMSAPEPGLDFE